jgi:hypothetical protein
MASYFGTGQGPLQRAAAADGWRLVPEDNAAAAAEEVARHQGRNGGGGGSSSSSSRASVDAFLGPSAAPATPAVPATPALDTDAYVAAVRTG